MDRLLAFLLFLSVITVDMGSVHAQVMTKDQQKCVGALHKDLSKVDGAVGKQIADCLKNHAKGKPLSKSDPSLVTLEAGVVNDEKGKIAKAEQKTRDDFAKACEGQDKGGLDRYPPFAATNATMVNAAGTSKVVDVSHDIFGSDLDSGVLVRSETSKSAAKCQQGVWKAATKCQATLLKEFASCAKGGLKTGAIASADQLEMQCQGTVSISQPDEKGKIAKACQGADGGIAKSLSKCDEDLDLDTLLPGCAGENHADCVAAKIAGRVCELINQADGLDRDCGAAADTCDAFELFTDATSPTSSGAVTAVLDANGDPGAFHFSAGSSMAFPNDTACLGLGNDRGDFSVSFWLKLDGTPSNQAILGTKSANSYFAEGFSILAATRSEFPGTAYLKVWLNDEYVDLANSQAAEVTSPNFPSGEWVHVTVIFDFDRRIEIFVDLDRRHNARIVTVPGSLGDGTLQLGEYITNSRSSQSASTGFSLSHVRTDRRVLSRSEVEDLYFEQAANLLSESELTSSAAALRDHIRGDNTLSGGELDSHSATLKSNLPLLSRSSAGVDAIWELVQTYETDVGPFFSTWNLSVETGSLSSLQDALFRAQQGLHTYGFSAGNLSALNVEGIAFETADYFPGVVPAAAPRETMANIHVNGTHLMPEKCGLADCGHDAKRPTGAYAAPGEIVTVDFPPQVLGAGLEVMVGGHTDALTDKKPTLKRFGEVTNTVPVSQARVKVANPFGGLLYVLVPNGSTLGDFTIEIANAVKAPMFSSRAASPTSVTDWNSEIKFYQAPWAEFVSDKFMFQLPSTMLTTTVAPDQVMANWDKAMDSYGELLGHSLDRHRPEYILLDLQLPHGGFGIGYPQIFSSNYTPSLGDETWNPLRFGMTSGFEEDHTFGVIFHEFGHAHGLPMLPSEAETIVNLPAVHIYHQKFGLPIDEAFEHSVHQRLNRNQAAIDWMIADNFRNGRPMDTTDSTANELRYQHRGHAKYVDIAMLFGWDAVTAGFSPVAYPWTWITPDEFLRNVSLHVGESIAPLLDFWGVPPTQAAIDELEAEGLSCSTVIRDRIEHYRSIAPMNASAFQIHYDEVIATIDPVQSIRYDALLPLYDESYGAAINDNINAILNEHYNSCQSNPCLNGGVLVDGDCLCSSGFDGLTCANDIDDCAVAPCAIHQMCVDEVNGFHCFENCETGWMGASCTDPCPQTKMVIESCSNPMMECLSWIDGNNTTASAAQCPSGQSGCFAMDVDLQLEDRYFVNRLRFRSDWHAKRPGTWELLASDDGVHYTKVMEARSNASPWRCVQGELCAQNVPTECCPGGVTQDTSSVGEFYAKWDDFEFAGVTARYWRFRILSTDDANSMLMYELELFGHRCLGSSCVVSSCGTGLCTGEDTASCLCADCQSTASCDSAFTSTVPACTVAES